MGLLNLFGGKKKELLALQKLVLKDSPNRLVMSEKQIVSSANRMVQRNIEIMNDCVRIVKETVKPDTFFMRLDLLEETTKGLSAFGKFKKYIHFSIPPFLVYANFRKDKPKAIAQFLVRYYEDTCKQAEGMKTEKGKINKYKKFYDSLQPYYDQMAAENIEYIEAKCQGMKEKWT